MTPQGDRRGCMTSQGDRRGCMTSQGSRREGMTTQGSRYGCMTSQGSTTPYGSRVEVDHEETDVGVLLLSSPYPHLC